tara:strand:- start:347 stop:1585 length:1239 start_codon:yes stop_codon:yes gene_type:complete
MINSISSIPLTVTQLNNQVKNSLHQKYSNVSVVGEVNNINIYTSGHAYFTLKDNNSEISCVFLNYSSQKFDFNLEDGDKLVLTGDVTMYIPKGKTQLSVNKIDPINQKGYIYRKYEQLKEKLRLEGLFENKYKKSIPVFPKRIGVLTSLEGSVLKDIIKVCNRRSKNIQLVLSQTIVQGKLAPQKIIKALDKLLLYNKRKKIDIIIIARGGGSFEDLDCFNDEELARKIFNIKIPIISAIGHETDFTITDFVADIRASTPSVAAELSTPEDRETIQSLDIVLEKLFNRFNNQLNILSQSYNTNLNRLKIATPYQFVENYKIKLLNAEDRMNYLYLDFFNKMNDRIEYYDKLLYNNNPNNILNKGFVTISDKTGKLIKKIETISIKDTVNIRFQDGLASAEINCIDKDKNDKK